MHTFQAVSTNKQCIAQAAAEDTKPIFPRCPDKIPHVFGNWGLLRCYGAALGCSSYISKELVTGIFKNLKFMKNPKATDVSCCNVFCFVVLFYFVCCFVVLFYVFYVLLCFVLCVVLLPCFVFCAVVFPCFVCHCVALFCFMFCCIVWLCFVCYCVVLCFVASFCFAFRFVVLFCVLFSCRLPLLRN
jgi:hypothetical protein